MRVEKKVAAMMRTMESALSNPEDKWQERDREWISGAAEALAWVVGDRTGLQSPEARVGESAAERKKREAMFGGIR